MLSFRSRVQQPGPNEGNKLFEFVWRKNDRLVEQRIKTLKYRFESPLSIPEIRIYSSGRRSVAPGGLKHIQMMPNGIVQPCERSVMEKSRLERDVAQR